MRDELKRLLAQEIGRGAIDWNDFARAALVELANIGDIDLPSEDLVACVVAELSNGVLSSAEDEAIARGVADLFRPIIAAQRARIAELEADAKQQQTNRDNWLNHVREQLGIPKSLGIVDFGKDQAKRIAAFELFMAADQPWSTVSAIERLIDGADHLLNDHDCDNESYESLIAARDVLRKRLDERRI